jgi:hypothetical protein
MDQLLFARNTLVWIAVLLIFNGMQRQISVQLPTHFERVSELLVYVYICMLTRWAMMFGNLRKGGGGRVDVPTFMVCMDVRERNPQCIISL